MPSKKNYVAQINRKARMLKNLQDSLAKQNEKADKLQKEIKELSKKQYSKWVDTFLTEVIENEISLDKISPKDVVAYLKEQYPASEAEETPEEKPAEEAPEEKPEGEKEESAPEQPEENPESTNEETQAEDNEIKPEDAWQAPQAF
ncbi:MAG: hypothetical protein ACI4OH_05185 [Mitsuokella sp.]|uniref:hypothetical protein n=1 Tax=Mitsuokella sp. TaxID=2049034 RepID=UPI003F01CD3D